MNNAPRFAFAALLLVVTGPAAADALYKCVDAKGVTSLQSSPCAKGLTQVWKRDSSPEPPQTPEQQAQLQARRQEIADTARAMAELAGTADLNKPVAAPPPPPPALVAEPTAPVVKGPCRQAHELQDLLRENDWLELTEGQQRKLDNFVSVQCQEPIGTPLVPPKP